MLLHQKEGRALPLHWPCGFQFLKNDTLSFLADDAFRYLPVFLMFFPAPFQEGTQLLLSLDSACRHLFFPGLCFPQTGAAWGVGSSGEEGMEGLA